jgi:hypothetical protein
MVAFSFDPTKPAAGTPPLDSEIRGKDVATTT